MADTYRRLAKTIECPKTKKDLQRIVDAEHEIINNDVCRTLRTAINQWCANNLNTYKPRYFGECNINALFRQRKMPCLKQVVKLARKLNLRLVLKTYPYAESFVEPWRQYAFDGDFEHAEFVAFLWGLSAYRSKRGDTEEMKLEREQILSEISNPNFALYWTKLIRYFAACGYQLSVRFVERDNKADEEALLRRLNYPA